MSSFVETSVIPAVRKDHWTAPDEQVSWRLADARLEPRGDGESPSEAMDRWRVAQRVCRTECPAAVFEHCDRSQVMSGGSGVWAGRILGGTR